MKVALVFILALTACGNVDAPIKTEAEANGGCWDPQECPAPGYPFPGGPMTCSETIRGDLCVTNCQPSGFTCWESTEAVTVYCVSSCAECAILAACP